MGKCFGILVFINSESSLLIVWTIDSRVCVSEKTHWCNAIGRLVEFAASVSARARAPLFLSFVRICKKKDLFNFTGTGANCKQYKYVPPTSLRFYKQARKR